MFITIPQIKAARALLEWDQEELARRAGLNVNQIRRLETARARPLDVVEATYKTFVSHGLDFVDDGVVKRKYEIGVLQGAKGFWDFYDDVYYTMREHGGDMLVHNVDEKHFVKWLGREHGKLYAERMHGLGNFRQKIIIKEGDTNFVADFATTEYRWATEGEFSVTPCYYIYGPKMAIILFEKDDVSVFNINQPKMNESFRALFMASWERAKIIPKDVIEKNRRNPFGR